MTSRIGSKGQVVIPRRLRERFNFGSGAEVELEEREDGVLIRPARARRPLGGRFKGSDLAADLLVDRAREPR